MKKKEYMKTVLYLSLLFMGVLSELNAQDVAIPNSNKHTVYIDNLIVGNELGLDFSMIPMVLFEYYYKDFTDYQNNQRIRKRIKEIYIEKDTIYHETHLHIRTKKAKDGYLLINKTIGEKITECFKIPNNTSISYVYVYNDKKVTTKREVKQLLRLRENKLEIISVIADIEKGVVTIYFED